LLHCAAATGGSFTALTGKIHSVDNVKTMRGAKTMAFDPKTGKIFSATVENVPLNATGPPNPKTVTYEPGPFVVLVVEK
jgi:hypothetical protein